MNRFLLLLIIACTIMTVQAQTNIEVTNPVAEQIMLGNYNPTTYQASNIIDNHALIAQGLQNEVSPDSLRGYLEVLGTFHNRNTFSDTVSNTKGIGAARRWILQRFQEFSAAHENRLITTYLHFNQNVTVAANGLTTGCTFNQGYKNVMAVLPGTDTSDKSVIIIQGHMDSRCADNCDTACIAEGVEDNGSGTALTMELARVMSKYTFKNTIVFVALTGEEQGLLGAYALAKYCFDKGIKVKAVLNNDISGGILCGYTSSPSGDINYPACSPFGAIDSTHLRIFSYGVVNSKWKQLARFIKLEYEEELLPYVTVPTTIWIMTTEDRTGRGSDHIPFRLRDFASVRISVANENGNASDQRDRQHTTRDVLGDDLTGDGILDTFYVDFNYLSRNARINGIGASMAAIGPNTPDFIPLNAGMLPGGGYNIGIQITQQTQYPAYRVAIRTLKNDFDSVYTIAGKLTDTLQFPVVANAYYISIASVDSNGVESLFSAEYTMRVTGAEELKNQTGILLMPNHPNPFDEATHISVYVDRVLPYKEAFLLITNIQGKEIKRFNITLNPGLNETLFEHGQNGHGTYNCSLVVDGKTIDTKRMVFTN